MDGAVTNDGRSVVIDWLYTARFAGRVHVFGPDGSLVASHDTRANLSRFTADLDAGIAFFTTASSGYQPHSNRLFAVRIEDGSLLWKSEGRVVEFSLDPTNRLVLVRGAKPDALGYDDGNRVEMAIPERELVRGYPAQKEAEKALAKSNLDAAKRLAEEAIQAGMTPPWVARAHRVLGEVAEHIGDTAEAVRCYRKALELDPKAPVRRKLAELRRPSS